MKRRDFFSRSALPLRHANSHFDFGAGLQTRVRYLDVAPRAHNDLMFHSKYHI